MLRVVGLVLLVGCASSHVSDTGALRARVERLYTAEQREDWKAWQQFVSPGADAAVAIARDVWVADAPGQRRKEEDQTDYWVRAGNEWYWVWRGWPND